MKTEEQRNEDNLNFEAVMQIDELHNAIFHASGKTGGFPETLLGDCKSPTDEYILEYTRNYIEKCKRDFPQSRPLMGAIEKFERRLAEFSPAMIAMFREKLGDDVREIE